MSFFLFNKKNVSETVEKDEATVGTFAWRLFSSNDKVEDCVDTFNNECTN